MKSYSFTIPGKLPGLNEYITACRTNRYQAASMKRGAESLVMAYARKALKGVRIKGRVWLRYYWNEPDKRRDKDNIASYGMKVIQDALVRCGILQGDGWKQIEGFSHRFTACPKEPHITVIIEVVSKDT